jgi:hypothetical protein
MTYGGVLGSSGRGLLEGRVFWKVFWGLTRHSRRGLQKAIDAERGNALCTQHRTYGGVLGCAAVRLPCGRRTDALLLMMIAFVVFVLTRQEGPVARSV